jgi:FKBP-type peptidyl-prolyl cis-trans isomerase
MKKTKLSLAALLLGGVCLTSCQNNNSSAKVDLKTSLDSVSYASGIYIGEMYAQQFTQMPGSSDFNKELVAAGFRHSLEKDSLVSQMNGEAAITAINNFIDKILDEDYQKAKPLNDQILAKNKENEGVKETASGLQYKIITEGTGAIPKMGDVVKVNYTGKLVDGTVFDSSVQRGEPAMLAVGRLIPGWTEALQLMPVGSKWELAIPSDLGYGKYPQPTIPANSVLFFEVELLDIVDMAQMQQQSGR